HAALLIYTDKPRQRFVIVDVVGELDRIKNLDYAGVNEYSANDKIENAPKNLHVTCHPSLVTSSSPILPSRHRERRPLSSGPHRANVSRRRVRHCTSRRCNNRHLVSPATSSAEIAAVIRSSDLRSTKTLPEHDRPRTRHPAARPPISRHHPTTLPDRP